MLIVYMF